MAVSSTVYAAGINRFPFRPFDDVKRPKTADEVVIAYEMLVNPHDGVDKLEAKILALYKLVRAQRELGYQLAKPKVTDSGAQWKVAIPASFSINEGKRSPDFLVCIDKVSGKITCFAPDQETH